MAIDVLTLALAKKMSGSSGGTKIQSDWNQSDKTALDYIKNKPKIATDDDAMDLLVELQVVNPVAASDGSVLTSSTGEIYTL
jgi:hypothetical protein